MQLQFRPENAHVITTGGGNVLVAAKSMSLFVMDPLADAILAYAQAHSRVTEDELVQALGDRFPEADIQETVKELMRLHVFVTGQLQVKPIQPIVDVERFPLGSLVLNVANKCNLHCSYCYEPEAAKYAPSPVQMEWDTARQSVDFLQRSDARPG